MPAPCRVVSIAMSALAALAQPVQAATWCVADSAGLALALAVAGDSTEGDVLRLQTGSFTAPAAVGYQGNLDGGDLEISGGWTVGCSTRTPGARSIIQGQDARPGLLLYGDPPQRSRVRIAHMGFNRGFGEEAGGLAINGGFTPVDVEIEDSRFTNNTLGQLNEYLGGALWVNVRGDMLLRGNVFSGNHAASGGGAAHLYCAGAIGSLINNTVTGNSAQSGGSTSRGGIVLGGNCNWELASNIMRGNDGRDLSFNSGSVYLRRNNLGSYSGTPAPGSAGNVDVDPQFVSASNLQLRRSSPMVDAGLAAPLQGLPGLSHDGGPRVVAGQVDIGAYELDRLFGNGFALVLIPIADPGEPPTSR